METILFFGYFYLLHFFSPNKQLFCFTKQIAKKFLPNYTFIQNSKLMRGRQKYARNLALMMAFLGHTKTGQKSTAGLAVPSCMWLKKPSLEFNCLRIFAVTSWRREIVSNIGRNFVVFLHSISKVNSVQEACARCFLSAMYLQSHF